MSLLFAFALIVLSSIGGGLAGLADTRAQDDSLADEMSEVVDADNLAGEAGQVALAQDDLPATEVPGVADDPPPPTATVPQLVEPTLISIEPGIEPTAAGDPEPSEDAEPTAVATEIIRRVIPADRDVIPADDPETDPTTSRVTVFKLTCPAGVARTGVDYFLSDVCRENPGPVEFSVTDNAGYSRSAFTSDVPQYVAFADVPFGAIEISETVPAGFGEPLVFCADTIAVDPGEFVPAPVFDGNAIAWEHRADAESELRCGFVNFQDGGEDIEPDTGVVRISKYTCPEGVARSDDDYLLSEQCREEVGQKEFTIYGSGGFFDSHYTSAGVPLETDFTGVPFGEIQIEETIVPPYGEPLAFCSDTPADGAGNYEPVPVTGGDTIAWVLRADAEIPLTCLFFNFVDEGEEEGNQLTVTKFDCPEGTVRAEGLPDLGTSCDVVSGVEFTAAFDGSSSTQATDGTGNARWTDVPVGPWSIQETIPAGYTEPKVFCGPIFTTEAPIVPSPGGLFAGEFSGTGDHMICTVFNFLDDDPGTGTVRVSKYTCPEGVAPSEDDYALSRACLEDAGPVEFSVRNDASYATSLTAAGGVPREAEFTGVPFGSIEIWETVPAGYGEPLVFCTDTPADGPGAYEPVPVADGDTIAWTLRADAEIPLACLFFNLTDGDDPRADSIVEVIKFTCPEGYDLNAWGADPVEDCPAATNGVTFTLTGLDPASAGQQAVTGVAGDGAVSFEDLEPGQYTVTEAMPAGTGFAFVLDCFGQARGELRPYPLSMGATLELEVYGGEHIVCLWYNVPEHDDTSLTLIKYTCSTETYVSDVDCEIYEDGKTFDLVVWNGAEWEYHSTAITDGQGQIHWRSLNPLEYWLDEQDGDWCHLTSDQLSGNGDWLDVYDGQETVVTVYNCDGVPGQPGKTPTRYPNTGADPEPGPGAPTELPAVAPLAGLLAWLATRRSHRFGVAPVAPVATDPVVGEDLVSSRRNHRSTRRVADLVSAPGPGTEEQPMPHTLTRRKLAALLTIPIGGTALVRSGILAQGDQVIEPIDGTPPGGTPTSLCLPATPDAGGDADACLRGPVPFNLRIEAIEVDAPVEILETVGGVMQQPSDEAHVAWYKETARLGETGNILIAGHLNWWGHPEAVFFDLGTLREGDAVVLLDEEERAFTYEVEWVRQESNLEPPAEEVLGMTGYEAVTLMTCGGQWDSSISEYDERTVARAMRVADDGTPEAI